MPEVGRSRTPGEPGHRYIPRRVTRRGFYDVIGNTAGTQKAYVPSETVNHGVKTPNYTVTQPAQQAASIKRDMGVDVLPSTQSSASKPKPALPRQNRSLVLRRRIEDSATHHKMKAKAQRQKVMLAFLIGGMASAVVVGGVLGYFLLTNSKQARSTVISTVPSILGKVTDGPQTRQISEAEVTQADLNAYTVGANKPRLLKIVKLGITARVYPVVGSHNGTPSAAPNVHDVGWLTSGPAPGTDGASAVINGAETGITKSGVFKDIRLLELGDEIVVQLGSGKQLTYKVIVAKSYAAQEVNINEIKVPAIAGRSGITLLTDTGRFNVKTNQFEKRTAVFAVLNTP